MSYRAAILLLQEDKVALIERQRAGLHYFTFPGGHVEEGETPEQAAVREAAEELGLQVVIKKSLARMGWQGKWQHYYLVEAVGGTFGTGRGEEMIMSGPEKGSYLPVWMAIDDLLKQPVLPHEMAELVALHARDGWPAQPIIIPEQK
jgi:8-oxo-dGTP pyrophosphatase MutT (NUDIX family)